MKPYTMKKKQFTSKLQFQKTTVVSFSAMLNVKGGALQNIDTIVVLTDGPIPLSADCTPTIGGCAPTTAVDNTCPPPTRETVSVFCTTGDVNNYTRRNCDVTIIVC